MPLKNLCLASMVQLPLRGGSNRWSQMPHGCPFFWLPCMLHRALQAPDPAIYVILGNIVFFHTVRILWLGLTESLAKLVIRGHDVFCPTFFLLFSMPCTHSCRLLQFSSSSSSKTISGTMYRNSSTRPICSCWRTRCCSDSGMHVLTRGAILQCCLSPSSAIAQWAGALSFVYFEGRGYVQKSWPCICFTRASGGLVLDNSGVEGNDRCLEFCCPRNTRFSCVFAYACVFALRSVGICSVSDVPTDARVPLSPCAVCAVSVFFCSIVDPVRRLKFNPMAQSSAAMARAIATSSAARLRRPR